MSEVLNLLFGSKEKARLLRFFLLNPGEEYESAEIMRKNMLSSTSVRRELNVFKKMRFVIERRKKGKAVYEVNPDFPFFAELRGLVDKSNVYPQCQSFAKIKGIGDVKLTLISGIFLNQSKSKIDMLLVVNSLNRAKLRNLMSSLEAEIGKEVRYFLLDSEEFKYRLNMLDRFLLEFLANPHEEIINRIPNLKRLIIGLKK